MGESRRARSLSPKRPAQPRPHVDRRRNPATVDDRTLVQWGIEHSGLSTVQFAKQVLHCSPRMAFRYVNGDAPLPALARDVLVRYVGSPLPEEAAS